MRKGKWKPTSKEAYEMYMQEEPYPFGKFPKTQYRLYSGRILLYFFVTTIREEEDCIDILLDRINSITRQHGHYGRYRIIKTSHEGEVTKLTKTW